MSWEVWGDNEPENVDHLLEAGWWDCERVDAVKGAIKALYGEQMYENGRKEEGVSVRFLMRLHILLWEAHIDVPQALVDEARNFFAAEQRARAGVRE